MIDTIKAYDALIERAMTVVSGPPYNTYVDSEADSFCRLEIEGDTARLMWPEIKSGYYNSTSIESQSVKFPVTLLTLDKEHFERWREEAKAAYVEKMREENRAAAHLNEMRERAALAQLKMKYPNG